MVPGERDPLSVLIVCDANVCRSPVAELVLAALLPDARVESAAVHFAGALPMCGTARRELSGEGMPHLDVERFAASFVSHPLDTVSLDDFHLVLAATRTLRSELAQFRPDARDRLFTLREAAALMEGNPVEDISTAENEQLVRRMNQRRDLVPLPDTGRRRLLSPTQHPFDIVDGHGSRPARHRRTIGLITESATTLGTRLSARKSP